MVNERLKVVASGVEFANPVAPSSGTFGFGVEMADVYDINVLGGISTKGTTLEARFGNPTPRVTDFDAGVINAVGLQNPGVDVLVNEKLPALRKVFKGVIIANISGFGVEEFVESCSRVDACPETDIIEVNVSCPNVKSGGLAFGTCAANAAGVVAAVKKVCTHKPIFVKLSPNVTDIVPIAKACEDAGADGFTLVNTLYGMRIDIARRKPAIANKYGGYSGKAVFPIAMRIVNQVKNACKVPIMGCGGVSCAEDVIEMMMAGATVVQVGAENLRNPYVCRDIVEALPSVMDKYGIKNLKDIIGIV